MTDNIFYQWVGYLCNPLRAADIHVETSPKKADGFRLEYRHLTGEVLLLPGSSKPFYIWPPNTNKWGTEWRVYFRGKQEALPKMRDDFKVLSGRSRGWLRINNKEFISKLFQNGFLIGDNTYNEERIRSNVPPRFVDAFERGYLLMSDAEKIREPLHQAVKRHCDKTGQRTFSADDLPSLPGYSKTKLKATLTQLSEGGIITYNEDRNVYTLRLSLLADEVDGAAARGAVIAEAHPEKREYLIETYARERGWVKLAKQIFGEKCMCKNCSNSFIKKDGRLYIEVHHIVPLHEGGEDGAWNLSVLCAHHHRMAHFARESEKKLLKKALLQKNHAVLGGMHG